MRFMGLSLSQAALLGGALGLTVFFLYLIKSKRRQVEVPFVPLWAEFISEGQHSQWSQKAKRMLSFLLYLLILITLLVALMDPKPDQATEEGVSIVLILDTSASMGAEVPHENPQNLYRPSWVQGPVTRLDLARVKAIEILDAMKPLDRVLIVDAQGESLSGDWQGRNAQLYALLDQLKVSLKHEDLSQALSMAQERLEHQKHARIVLISDGNHPNLPASPNLSKAIDFEHILVPWIGDLKLGDQVLMGNLSIRAFNIRRYPSRKRDYEAYIAIENHFDQPACVGLRLNHGQTPMVISKESDEIPVYCQSLGLKFSPDLRWYHIAPHAQVEAIFQHLPVHRGRISASLQLKSIQGQTWIDVLPMDDHAFVYLPAHQPLKVLLISRGNLYLEAFFLAHQESYPLTLISPEEDWISQLHAHDVAIFDDIDLPVLPKTTGGHFFYIRPRGKGSPFKLGKKVQHPVVERVHRHHLLARWLSIKDLQIQEAQLLRRNPKDIEVVRAIQGPLILAREQDGTKMVAMAFNPAQSDMVLRIAMPLFLINLMDWFEGEENHIVEAFPVGHPWRIPLPANFKASEISVFSPSGNAMGRFPVFQHHLLFQGQEPGYYTLSLKEEGCSQGKEGCWEIAAQFYDPLESKTLNKPLHWETQRTSQSPSSNTDTASAWIFDVFAYFELWMYALFFTLFLLTFEWFTYHRRYTV